NRGIAAGTAASDIAFVDHSDICDAVILCQIVCGGEAVETTANNHHIVTAFHLRLGPNLGPAFLGKTLGKQLECRIAGTFFAGMLCRHDAYQVLYTSVLVEVAFRVNQS